MNKSLSKSVMVAALLAFSFLLACAPGAAPQAAKQELRANLAAEPETIDPNKAAFSTQVTVIKQVFQGLLSFNQDLTLKAVVAKEVPSVKNKGISEDGLVYTFKLRDDVKWSDGQKVTAKDFEYSIKRLLDPALAAQYASFYHDIKGAKEYNTALGTPKEPKKPDEATLKSLRGGVAVKATDDTTLQITLARPRNTFLQLMALWATYPVRQDIVERFGAKWTEPPNYIGNGPFKLTEWVHQDHITLEANPNYWGTKPKLQKIVLRMFTDLNAEYAAYLNNELDMTRVPPGNEKQIIADAQFKTQLLRNNEMVTLAFQFNIAKPPFDNALVRRAIATAIDRETFIDKVRSGVGRVAYAWIPSGMPGHQPDLGKQYKFDVAKAKKLLSDAGYPEGKGLPLTSFQYADTSGNRVIAQFLQGQMKDNLGITVNLEPMETKAFQQLVGQKKFQWSFFFWGADYPDPDNWLPEVFGTDGGNNLTQYSNPKLDDVLKKAAAELDEKKRLTLWAEAEKIVIDDSPVVPVAYRERFFLIKPTVKGLKTTSMDATLPGDWFYAEVSRG
ncbi:MAG: peptide ABC transporter substrate-binding protein [Chloroflexi bacterium]|nr:peptide ABC transporter substrate-binding protein [Chloroflexota bacterium]